MGRARRGIALVVALLALIALAGILAASYFPALESERAGQQDARLELLAGSAELGLARGLAALTPGFLQAHPAPGVILASDTTLSAPSRTAISTVVTRSPAGALWVGAVAKSPGLRERRARHLLVEELLPRFPAGAALVSRSEPVTSGTFTISGSDAAPPGASDCPPPASAAPVQLTSDDAILRHFGPDSVESLRGAALLLSPDSATGVLPAAPVLAVDANAVIGPGSGEGILLAAANLRVQGPFSWAGVIVTSGALTLATDVHVQGLVIAAGQSVTLEGSGSVQRSQCAITRAARRLVRVATRGPWRWGISY